MPKSKYKSFRKRNIDALCEHILISGELTSESIEPRLAKLKRSSKAIQYLIVKLDYVPDLQTQAYILNDLLFYLCYFRCFFVKSEPFFLPEQIQVLVEVQTYHSDYLYRQVSFLANLPKTTLEFDLTRLEIGSSIECPIQTACFFMHQVIEKKETRQFTKFPTQNLFSKIPINLQDDAVNPSDLNKQKIIDLLSKYYIDNQYRKGKVTFASLLLFCKIVAYEFKNLNSNNLLNMETRLLGVDIRSKKPLLFKLVLDVCVRAINPSIKASETQRNTFDSLRRLPNRYTPNLAQSENV